MYMRAPRMPNPRRAPLNLSRIQTNPTPHPLGSITAPGADCDPYSTTQRGAARTRGSSFPK